MKQWQYDVFYMGDPFRANHGTVKQSLAHLNTLGRAGWDAVFGFGGYVVLKREIKEADDAEDL